MSSRHDIVPGTDYATLLKSLRKAMRAGEPLLIAGDLAGGFGGDSAEWAGLLDTARVPVAVAATGPVGPRGLALMLLADIAVATPDAAASEDLRAMPGLSALAVRCLGSAGRRCIFSDPLTVMEAQGHLLRATDPVAEAEVLLAALPAGARPALNAARHLPFAEALEFDLLQHRTVTE